mgnify:CR=1 FL=1
MDLKTLKIGQTQTVAAKSPFDAAEKAASSGHYLERLEGICKAFGLKDLVALVGAVKKYVLSSHKPQWVDGLVHDVSQSIVYHAEKLNPKPEDWTKIVWGLEYDVLKEHGLDKYRERGGVAQKENH